MSREFFIKLLFFNFYLNILFSTYSYYPYNYGGTEVYISGLASYLQKHGHSVTIIAGIPQKAFEEYPVFYEDDQLKTLQYLHEGINIIGIVLKDESTTEFYRKYRSAWVKSWARALQKFSNQNWDMLHLHGLTSPIGLALVEAVQQHSGNLKVAASYHVPVTCVKGTLLFSNQQIACNVPAGTAICTACSISDKKNISLPLAKSVAALLPARLGEVFPTALRMKYLVSEFVKTFRLLNAQIDRWFVFSDQIQKILHLDGVDEKKTILVRHGINAVFKAADDENISERKHIQPIVFLYAGRFDKVKGFNTLIKAWSLLTEEPHRVLKIIGENQTHHPTLNEVRITLGKRKDIQWLGKQSPESLAGIMKESHCVIIPSEWIEIGPLVFHEAIAAGCDVIASDLGGCAELAGVYSSKTSLFPAGNTAALADCIDHFSYSGLSLPVNLQENNYQQVLDVYEDLLQNKPEPNPIPTNQQAR